MGGVERTRDRRLLGARSIRADPGAGRGGRHGHRQAARAGPGPGAARGAGRAGSLVAPRARPRAGRPAGERTLVGGRRPVLPQPGVGPVPLRVRLAAPLATIARMPEPAEVLFSQEDIRRRVRELGTEITRDYQGRSPILICVLKGSAVFLADLIREIRLPARVDFMAISPYGEATEGARVVRIVKDLDEDITGQDVI